MRNVIAVLMGAAVAFALVSVGDAMAARLFALPPGLDPRDPATKGIIEAAIAKAPLSAILTMVSGYFVAAFGGAFIARKIASSNGLRRALTVGALVLVAVALNFIALSHPTLMVVLGVLVPLPAAWLGGTLAGSRETTPARV